MDTETIKIFGQVAGIGGISLGVFLVLFRNLINKSIYPILSKSAAYNLFKIMMFLVWSIAIVGILAWFYIQTGAVSKHVKIEQTTIGISSPIVSNIRGNVSVNSESKTQ